MLEAYPMAQLVEEVLVAWNELAARNEEVVGLSQRVRVLELDLADREDGLSPERAALEATEQSLREKETQAIHLERLLQDARTENEALRASQSAEDVEALRSEVDRLNSLASEQDDVIAELEVRLDEVVDALERAAEAGLTSVTAEEVRNLQSLLSRTERELSSERAARETVDDERSRLRDIADRLRGILEQRDRRIVELEEQIERAMHGPRSVSAEHDYLTEQIEDLKRRLLDRNREYESLRRRERRLHTDVFERDERIQQMQLTMADLEAALQDRIAEYRDLERLVEQANLDLAAAQRSDRTREVVGRAFADSLGFVRDHERRGKAREERMEAPTVTRTVKGPGMEEVRTLASGEEVEFESESVEITGEPMSLEDRPFSPGGTADPVVWDDD